MNFLEQFAKSVTKIINSPSHLCLIPTFLLCQVETLKRRVSCGKSTSLVKLAPHIHKAAIPAAFTQADKANFFMG